MKTGILNPLAGILLPSSPNSPDANTFDCYAENRGTWAPSVLNYGGNGVPSFSGESLSGYYTRLGNAVLFAISHSWSGIGGYTGQYVGYTLPFQAAVSNPVTVACNNSFNVADGYGFMALTWTGGISVYMVKEDAPMADLQWIQAKAAGSNYISGFFFV